MTAQQYIPRYYQADAIARGTAFMLDERKKSRNGVIYIPSGGGKSLAIGATAVELANTGPVMVFQPTKEILEQNVDKIKSYGFRPSIFSASSGQREISDLTLATIGSVFRHPEWFEDFQFGLIDECFVAGTLVDGRPIETVCVGDQVAAFDHKTLRYTSASVLAVSKTPVPNELCCLRVQGVPIMSTLNHPYYVLARGYVAARDAKKGDIVLAQITTNSQISESVANAALHVLRFTRDIEGLGPLASVAEDWACFPQGVCAQERCEELFCSNESTQPDGERCRTPQDGDNTQAHRAQAAYSGRKREAYAEAATSGAGVSREGLVSGIGGTDQAARQGLEEVSDLLQNRHSEPHSADRRGDRRREPLWNEADARCKENGILKFARVDSVEILQQTSSRGSSSGNQYDYVYNLQVETHSNYFANGVLVHNCHLASLKDNSKIVRAGEGNEFFHRELGLVKEIANQEDVKKGRVRVVDEDGEENVIDRPKKSMYTSFIEILPHMRWLGYTASPYKLQSDAMGSQLKVITRTRPRLWDEFVSWVQNKQLFDQGFLSELEYYPIHGFKRSSVTINSTVAEYDEKALQMHLWEKRWETQNKKACNFSDKLFEVTNRVLDAGRRNVLIFTATVQESVALAHQMKGECAVVTGETPKSERENVLRDFRSGAIKAVANCGVLVHGFDFPELECVIDAAPTMSLSRYYQKVGRAVRTHPNKKSAWIIDMVESYQQFGPVEELTLYCQGNSRWDVFGRPGGPTQPQKQLTTTYLGGNALKGCCPKCHAPKTVMYYTAKKKWLPVSRPPPGSFATLIVEYVNNKPHCRMVKRDDPDAHKATHGFHFVYCDKFNRLREEQQ